MSSMGKQRADTSILIGNHQCLKKVRYKVRSSDCGQNLTWCITHYVAKKRHASSNTSALLAKTLAYHHAKGQAIMRFDKSEQKTEVISYLMGGVTETLKYHVIVYHQRRYTTHRVSAARYLAAMDTKIYRGSRARTTSPVSTGMTAAPANARLALRPGSPQLGTHVD
jgi:hypothetical protein